jgi:hypothetical protein
MHVQRAMHDTVYRACVAWVLRLVEVGVQDAEDALSVEPDFASSTSKFTSDLFIDPNVVTLTLTLTPSTSFGAQDVMSSESVQSRECA